VDPATLADRLRSYSSCSGGRAAHIEVDDHLLMTGQELERPRNILCSDWQYSLRVRGTRASQKQHPQREFLRNAEGSETCHIISHVADLLS